MNRMNVEYGWSQACMRDSEMKIEFGYLREHDPQLKAEYTHPKEVMWHLKRCTSVSNHHGDACIRGIARILRSLLRRFSVVVNESLSVYNSSADAMISGGSYAQPLCWQSFNGRPNFKLSGIGP